MRELTFFDKSVVSTCLVLAFITMLLNWQSPVARRLLQGERVSALLIGSDYDGRVRHSDTLMFISFDPVGRFLDVMSIPRDTQMSIPNAPSIRRVNEIFGYEFRHAGRDFNIASLALKSYVETLLSSGAVRALQIPFYLTVDYKSFPPLIDALGGVYVTVTEPMRYDDNWGNLHIHFEPGTYLLDGRKALEYVRYRGGATADHGRMLRQQIFIKEVLKRMKSPVLLWSLPKYGPLVLDGIHTNFTFWDLFSLVLEGRSMRWKNLRLFSAPGSANGVLWKMNPTRTQHIVGMMQETVSLSEPPLKNKGRAALESKSAATVEVWNASSHPSVAKVVVQMLRDEGFDVVHFGNFSTRQQRTLVIDRSGRLRPAQAVAEALREAHPEVVSRVDLSRQVDVSVILGNDAPFSKKRMKLR